MSVVIEQPRSPRSRKAANWEKYGWMYMRASGVILIFLIFGHLFANLWAGEGISAIDFAFVGGNDDVPEVSVGKTSVGKEDRALLQEALYDLLECKRLLDQVLDDPSRNVRETLLAMARAFVNG